MRTLAFDGRMGASGDMLLGALLDAGADPGALDPVADALDVEYVIGRVEDHGISATDVRIEVGDETDLEDGRGHSHADENDHRHGADHDNTHGVDQDQAHESGHDHSQDGPGHRTYDAVVSIVEGLDLPDDVRNDALAIVRILGEAEATVHDTDLGATPFHEVGADDAIADIVGVALLVDDLDPDRIVSTPVAAGAGEVAFSHGTYPVPTPAVTAIAAEADWELRGGPVDGECCTPTGAAILAHLADGVDHLPALAVDATGYGAGDRQFEDRPNVCRAIIGTERGLEAEDLAVLETNVDDVSPEVLGDLHDSLAEAGAYDVSVVPLTMKSSRPGHLVRVIADPADAASIARRLAEETGTLGVRRTAATHRWTAPRRIETVHVDLDGATYAVDVKVATDAAGEVIDRSAEFADARRVARETGRPVREVMVRAEAAVDGAGVDEAGGRGGH
jgi:uncharacterized protein (TIGR00299 family) protein